MRHLALNLESPLMSFGGETIDNYGVIRWFPGASMLTGLFANALGRRGIERERHQRLQDSLVFAARIDREPAGGVRLTDFQTALPNKGDKGWTTRGTPEGRAGGPRTYDAPHLRYRDYFAICASPSRCGWSRKMRRLPWKIWPTRCENRRARFLSGESRACPQRPFSRGTSRRSIRSTRC